jgi:L-fucose isomerase-like protein
MSRITLFLPGDYRPTPNELAEPNVRTFIAALTKAVTHLGHEVRLIDRFLSTSGAAIEELSGIDEPMIGVYAHWVYGPHTTDGVVGSDAPLLLASNFDGTWPGLVGLLNTGACLTSLNRKHSRLWSDAADLTRDEWFMDCLDGWIRTGDIEHDGSCLHQAPAPRESRVVDRVQADLRARRPLIMMLGDTSMGMVNGYFGPQRLAPVGFSEHKVDQAWLIEACKDIDERRVDDALAFVRDKGVTFHYGNDFGEEATRGQLRAYCAVLDFLDEFRADCLGWQYQLGLIRSLPPSDFAEGLLNSACRPEGNGSTVVCATEADQGNVLPMELLKRLLLAHGLHESVAFHDVRWGGVHDGRFIWVLLNSGSAGAYAFNHDPDTLHGVHSYRQPPAYFPIAGGTFAGESLPGRVTWARTWLDGDGSLVMDVGRGEVVGLPPAVRDAWWQGTTPEWPFMAADLGISRDDLMAHYQSNHVAVAYGDVFDDMVELSRRLGFRVRVLARS